MPTLPLSISYLSQNLGFFIHHHSKKIKGSFIWRQMSTSMIHVELQTSLLPISIVVLWNLVHHNDHPQHIMTSSDPPRLATIFWIRSRSIYLFISISSPCLLLIFAIISTWTILDKQSIFQDEESDSSSCPQLVQRYLTLGQLKSKQKERQQL